MQRSRDKGECCILGEVKVVLHKSYGKNSLLAPHACLRPLLALNIPGAGVAKMNKSWCFSVGSVQLEIFKRQEMLE